MPRAAHKRFAFPVFISPRRFATISGHEVFRRNLKVMDLTAISLCQESGLPIVVFNMDEPGMLLRVLRDAGEGTLIQWDDDTSTLADPSDLSSPIATSAS